MQFQDLGKMVFKLVDFLSRDDSSMCGQREMDVGIGYKLGLEFCEINIKSEGSSDGGHNWTYQPI